MRHLLCDNPQQMKRIEFVFFDAGGGHRSAATALGLAIQEKQLPWQIEMMNLQEILDELDILRKYAGIRIQDFYNQMLKTGWTLGSAELMRVLQAFIRLYRRPMVRRLEQRWRETAPDMLVSFIPHFNRALFMSYRNVFPDRPYVTILTDIADYPPHFWIERQRQYFICGSDRAMTQAHELGHSDEEIFHASGMILQPRFYAPQTAQRGVERIRLGLQPDVPTGLVLFGGHGNQVMLEIAESLDKSNLDLQLIFICGKNQPLSKTLRERNARIRSYVEGFTSEIPYYMHLSDFFIGKPGPGSLSEALAMQLPVITECNAWTLPQERYNAKWITERNVGLSLKSFREIVPAVEQLLEPATFAEYRKNAALHPNRAIFEIPGFLEQILQQYETAHRPPTPAVQSAAI
ncbi:MAG TPA: glycosyltransferase [Candidatus Acidoferrales bacterium]|nr:glycosyltransferase [Candidatus Acidoferrales bacterium]